jgi:drug/metabolite transporter (DMT)-like permease
LERLILFLYPTFVVVLSVLFYRRPLRKKELFALLLSYVGIAIVFQHDIGTVQQNLILGSSLVFASAWAYALYLIGSGRSIARLGAMRFMSYVMIVACFACFAQFLFTRPLNAVFSQAMPVYTLGIAMALFSTVAPAFLLALGIRHIGASRASLISSIGPITTIFLAYFFLNEPMSVVQLCGSALVLAGVLLVSL